MPKFIIGDTIQFKAEIRDYEGNRIDPTSINVEIRDANDALIDTVTLQKESKYKFFLIATFNPY